MDNKVHYLTGKISVAQRNWTINKECYLLLHYSSNFIQPQWGASRLSLSRTKGDNLACAVRDKCV